MPITLSDYAVELPAGGTMHLQSPDEVQLWETALERYREDYVLEKHNDLVTLGALLQAQITLFRAQTAINGMEPQLDGHGVPTGSYRRVDMDGSDLVSFQKAMTEASKEMRACEKQLGIDKATREAGGAHTLDNYLATLKKAANSRGIHISKRTLAYEEFVMELRWRLRLLAKGDAEDRSYHNVTPKTILLWAWEQTVALEEIDRKYAKEKGRLFVGQL